KSDFLAAMDDDFNAPQAVAILFDLSREVNQMLNSGTPLSAASLQGMLDLYRELGNILGLNLLETNAPQGGSLDAQLMDLIIALRQEIRAQKLWPLSDKIRDGLAKLGIVLEDKKDGTTWKRGS
ncbi:MAG: cysS, partial [Bacteroidetes bacterium]|nr:cysS [Bacteroidota bacterium]